jgi:hypothetical protein
LSLIDWGKCDRFTTKIKVHPRKWSREKWIHKFKLILFNDENQAIRISHHTSIECAEQSIREYLEFGLGGRGEIYEINQEQERSPS